MASQIAFARKYHLRRLLEIHVSTQTFFFHKLNDNKPICVEPLLICWQYAQIVLVPIIHGTFYRSPTGGLWECRQTSWHTHKQSCRQKAQHSSSSPYVTPGRQEDDRCLSKNNSVNKMSSCVSFPILYICTTQHVCAYGWHCFTREKENILYRHI